MHVLVSGSTGFLGSAIVPSLETAGHRVTRLVRSRSEVDGRHAYWDPESGAIDLQALPEPDALVHLAGENIVGRWTDKKKARIRDSRVIGTRKLCEAAARWSKRPKVLVAASAIGFYGNRGDAIVREDSPSGTGFLAEVCREWEAAAQPVIDAGIRVVHLRFGMVLSAEGGALARMLTPFRLGLGATIGDGRQFMSWIARDDVVGVIRLALDNHAIAGPLNVVTPNPVTNAQFTKALGRALGRPTFFRVPVFVVRTLFGEMADEMLLTSVRVEPARLLDLGYAFCHPHLDEALRHELEL